MHTPTPPIGASVEGMRSPSLLTSLACACVPAFAAHGLTAQGPIRQTTGAATATFSDLFLVDYGADLSVRDGLVDAGRFFGDLGRLGLARLGASQLGDLGEAGIPVQAVPEVLPGEVVIAAARDAAGIGPIHGRLLLARRAFFLTAAWPDEVPDTCRGSGFHGGVQVLHLDRPYATTATGSFPIAEGVDPTIAAMVAQVQQPNLLAHVNALSAIFTRRTTAPENAQAVSYVTSQLATIPGLTFTTETFNASYGPNVIAEIPGTDLANEIVMVGAHLDSIVGGSSSARSPGADDNASGSAAVLEIARIFAGQQFRRTVRFGWWNAEELGLIGADAYSQAAANRGDRIVAYVNTDMNAYRAPGDSLSLDFVTNDSTPSLVAALRAATATYVPSLPTNAGSLSGGTSDHRAFFRNGFPAAFPFEDLGNYSPYIHTSNDTVGTSANDFQLSELITQAVLAGVAELAEIGVANPGDFQVYGQGCTGTGQQPAVCASLNDNGGTLTNTTRANEYCYRVVNTQALQVESFEIFTASTTGGDVTVDALLYLDAGGLPAASPAAQVSITVGSTPGFYLATLPTPLNVTGDFYVGLDHSAQTTYLSNLSGGTAGAGFWRRPVLTGNWAQSGLIQAPSFRIRCAGGGTNLVPQLGNDGTPLIGRSYDVTLSGAAAGVPAVGLLGLSDQVFAGGSLPLPIPGAPGCSLLASTDDSVQVTTDGRGAGSFTIPVPNDTNLIGAHVYHQWIVIDAGANQIGLAVSDGGRALIGG